MAVAALFATAPFLSSQQLNFGPHYNDFFFYEAEDGSIFTADAHGTYYFATFQDYVASSFFQEHGMHCGSERLPQFHAMGTTADCNSSSTNPASEYDPNGGQVYEIPVVFHILRRNNGTGEVSDALINSQIDILNEDFRALAGSSNGTPQDGVDTRIQFTLAGITRSNKNSWYNDSGSYYNSLSWDTTQYLNIYTNQAGGNLGYAYVPSGGGVVGSSFDRVVLNWRYVGRNSPGGAPYNQGRTGTHEVGHYLGLYHTFQGGCASGGCYTSGDLICDTAPEASPFYGCGTRDSCSGGGPDPTENYMDYTDDLCMNGFTAEQANRMRCTLANFRVDLAGGGDPPPPPPAPGQASNPNPADGATNVPTTADLNWSGGSDATSHNVYFGTSNPPSLAATGVGSSYDPGTLSTSTTYYWRVDSVNDTDTTTGTVWSFTTDSNSGGGLPGKATDPDPADGRNRVRPNTNLTWTPAAGLTGQVFYLSTNSGNLGSGFNVSGTTIGINPASNLLRRTTYYWRVDSVNGAGTTTGDLWSFTTR